MAHKQIITQGQVSIIDATVIEAHQSRSGKDKDGNSTRDPEAGWHVKGDEKSKKGKTYTYGYSLHVKCDEDGFIMKQETTPGEVHDSQMREALMTGCESELYADSAYASAQTDADLRARKVKNYVQGRGYRNRPLTQEDHDRNKEIAFTRGRVEPIFGSYKVHRSLRKTRFMGLLKNATQFGFAAIMHNLQKAARFVERYGLVPKQPQHCYV